MSPGTGGSSWLSSPERRACDRRRYLGIEARTVELASSFSTALLSQALCVPGPMLGAVQLSVQSDWISAEHTAGSIGSSSERCVSADGDPTEAHGDADGEGLAAVLRLCFKVFLWARPLTSRFL